MFDSFRTNLSPLFFSMLLNFKLMQSGLHYTGPPSEQNFRAAPIVVVRVYFTGTIFGRLLENNIAMKKVISNLHCKNGV